MLFKSAPVHLENDQIIPRAIATHQNGVVQLNLQAQFVQSNSSDRFNPSRNQLLQRQLPTVAAQVLSMRPQPSPIQEPIVPHIGKINKNLCSIIYYFYNLSFTLTGRSGKGSCSAPAVLGDDMDDDSPCLLYVLDGTGTMLVACGIMFKVVTVVHGMELSKDEVKVSVDDIIISDALVPLSTDEIFTVA
ncbi:hypothetical protein LR48_Vigan09g126700 [Vigna angularis]|uniref:DUF8039 domain-containing protein n=1 Tax=Phaseolus angularis TaxID=3914 RepID=A0A0L9VC77_PHAAN|nr:hypothetical protein LR48_Vigan09g126700 [Vigna angularis]